MWHFFSSWGCLGCFLCSAKVFSPFPRKHQVPYSNVDLSTTNILFSIPIRSKIGAVPFQYSLVANSDPHAGFAVNGGFKGTLTGPSGVLSAGLVPGSIQFQDCADAPDSQTRLSDWAVIDSTGAFHPLPAK